MAVGRMSPRAPRIYSGDLTWYVFLLAILHLAILQYIWSAGACRVMEAVIIIAWH